MEYFNYAFENGERIYPEPRQYDAIRKTLINDQKTIVINENLDNYIEEHTGEKPKAVPGTKLPKSVIFVPISVDGIISGYISLQNLDKEQAFSEDDINHLNTISNSVSIALENARLLDESEQRNAELAVINSVQHGLVAEMDMQGIYDLVGDRVRDLSDAQVTSIVTFDTEKNIEEFQYLYKEERLEAFLKKHADDNINKLLRGIIVDVLKFANKAKQSDDITLLVLEYLGIENN